MATELIGLIVVSLWLVVVSIALIRRGETPAPASADTPLVKALVKALDDGRAERKELAEGLLEIAQVSQVQTESYFGLLKDVFTDTLNRAMAISSTERDRLEIENHSRRLEIEQNLAGEQLAVARAKWAAQAGVNGRAAPAPAPHPDEVRTETFSDSESPDL